MTNVWRASDLLLPGTGGTVKDNNMMPPIASWTALFALAIITLIGLDILFRVPKRREDRGAPSPMVPGDIDPANLRRRRPLTQRLSGAVLVLAAIVLYVVVRPALGF